MNKQLMYVPKITPSVDYIYWLKSLDTTSIGTNESQFKHSTFPPLPPFTCINNNYKREVMRFLLISKNDLA